MFNRPRITAAISVGGILFVFNQPSAAPQVKGDDREWGACCFGPDCYEMEDWECWDYGGDDFFPGTPCYPNPCGGGPTWGACCIGPDCYDVMDESECWDSGGDDFFPEVYCYPGLCGPEPGWGACCFEYGACEEMQEIDCYDAGGGDPFWTSFALGASCAPGLCADYGEDSACCAGWAAPCFEEHESVCSMSGGGAVPCLSCSWDPCAHLTYDSRLWPMAFSPPSVADGADLYFSTYGATTDGPLVDEWCDFSQINADIWVYYVSPYSATGMTTVSLWTGGSGSFDTALAVYDASYPYHAWENPPIACNSDPYGEQSEVEFITTGGDAYLIRIGSPWSGETGEGTMTITCEPPQPPVADAGGPYLGFTGEEITFDASASSDADGTIVGYRWDWTNDGEWNTDWLDQAITTNSYGTEFCGEVRVQVKDNDGATDTDKAPVFVCTAGSGSDLTILPEDLRVPAYAVEGSSYVIQATVRNIGCDPAQYNFKVRFLEWGPSDTDWTSIELLNVFELGPGESVVKGTWWQADEPGTYRIKAVADSEEDIAEEDEKNNEAEGAVIALPIVEIRPSVRYTWQYEQLHLDAYVYNNYAGEAITGPPGWVTWKLFDSDGMVVPGYGEHIEFTLDSGDDVWKWHGDVSDLTTGETYTVKVYYGFGYETPIDLFKESGIAWVQGYVYDDDGVGIENATVELDAFDVLGPDYSTTTGSDGLYSFDEIEAWVYKGKASCNPPECAPGPLRPSVRPFIAKSDQTTEADFVLYVDAEVEFGRMLNRLRSACEGALGDLETDLLEMNHDYIKLAKEDQKKVAWNILDITGSIIVGLGGGVASGAVTTLAEGSSPAFAAALIQVIGEAKFRYGVMWSQALLLVEAGSDLYFAVAAVDELADVEGKLNEYYATDVYGLLDNIQTDFLSQVPPVVDPDFDFERAHRVIAYVSRQLEDLTETDDVVIPFKYDQPNDFRFPKAKRAFDQALGDLAAASAAQKGRIVAKIAAGIAGILAAPFTGGASVVIAMTITTAVDVGASTLLTGAEVSAKWKAGESYSTAAGLWFVDVAMVDDVFYKAADFLLEEGDTPRYLDQTRTFDATITHLDINAAEFFDLKIVVGPWFGGEASNPAEITIENTGNADTNVFARINRVWRHYPNPSSPPGELPVGVQWDVDDNAHRWETGPYVPWLTFVPRKFRVKVYAGLPDSPTDSAKVDYYRLPWWPGRGALNLSSPLPLSTSAGRLTLRDTEELYPTEYLLWEGDLDATTSGIELSHTVGVDASSVEFHCSYPPQSIIGFFVSDADGNRIGHNLTTGLPDVQFPGTFTGRYSNPQVISIPLAGGKTFTVRAELAAWYSDEEKHHVTLKAFEVPARPAVLSVESEQIDIIAYPGTEATVSVMFGETGGQQPLQGVQVSLGEVAKDGEVLPLLSDLPVEVGVILPGTGTSVPFTLDIPWEAEAGLYTGDLEVTTANAGSLSVTVLVDVSDPPNKPSMPSGPALGLVDVPYEYSVSSADPEGDEIYYQFSWGDGTYTDWLGPYASGEICNASHAWAEPGRYHVIVAAKDGGDHVSEFSDELPVCIHGEPYADPDQDGDIDLQDFAAFSDCLAGPGVPLEVGCEVFDMDCDEDVDLFDFAALQVVFTGSL